MTSFAGSTLWSALVESAITGSFNKVGVCLRFHTRASLTLVPLLFRFDPLFLVDRAQRVQSSAARYVRSEGHLPLDALCLLYK